MTEGEMQRCIAVARTFLYDYGQGVYSPIDMYFDCCHLIGCKTCLSGLPAFKLLPPFSFFSKKHLRFHGAQFCLFEREDEQLHFLTIGMAAQLNWVHNFTTMQILLFNFSHEQLEKIEHILTSWQRPVYDYLTFSAARTNGSPDPKTGSSDVNRFVNTDADGNPI